MSNFFFSLNLRQIKKFVILFYYCPKYIGKRKEKRKEKTNRSKRCLLVYAAEN
jgi:hypothetical protein